MHINILNLLLRRQKLNTQVLGFELWNVRSGPYPTAGQDQCHLSCEHLHCFLMSFMVLQSLLILFRGKDFIVDVYLYESSGIWTWVRVLVVLVWGPEFESPHKKAESDCMFAFRLRVIDGLLWPPLACIWVCALVYVPPIQRGRGRKKRERDREKMNIIQNWRVSSTFFLPKILYWQGYWLWAQCDTVSVCWHTLEPQHWSRDFCPLTSGTKPCRNSRSGCKRGGARGLDSGGAFVPNWARQVGRHSTSPDVYAPCHWVPGTLLFLDGFSTQTARRLGSGTLCYYF